MIRVLDSGSHERIAVVELFGRCSSERWELLKQRTEEKIASNRLPTCCDPVGRIVSTRWFATNYVVMAADLALEGSLAGWWLYDLRCIPMSWSRSLARGQAGRCQRAVRRNGIEPPSTVAEVSNFNLYCELRISRTSRDSESRFEYYFVNVKYRQRQAKCRCICRWSWQNTSRVIVPNY